MSESLQAKRGWLYRWHDDKAEYKDKYVVIVSAESRETDGIISMIVLGDSSAGNDVVPVKVPNLRTMYAHCGTVTYLAREKLTEEICQISKKTMKDINKQMLWQYGLVEESKIVEYNHYKEEYNNLIEKLLNGEK